jgi:hypothetical protein
MLGQVCDCHGKRRLCCLYTAEGHSLPAVGSSQLEVPVFILINWLLSTLKLAMWVPKHSVVPVQLEELVYKATRSPLGKL